jgi:hypothetical protein
VAAGLHPAAIALDGGVGAVAAGDVGDVGLPQRGDLAGGGGDAGQLADAFEQRRRDRRVAAARGALDQFLLEDRDVGRRGRRVVDRETRPLRRVGEDERARHHRDADDDGERRQQRADLAAGDALERDGDHERNGNGDWTSIGISPGFGDRWKVPARAMHRERVCWRRGVPETPPR